MAFGVAFFLLLALLFSYKIIRNEGYLKLPWFFAGILFFPTQVVLFNKPLIMSFPRLMIFVLFFTLLFQKKYKWKLRFAEFPIRGGLFFITLMLFLIGFFDIRIELAQRFIRPFIYFLENFAPLFLTYLCVRRIEEFEYLTKFLLYTFVVFCVYGMLNYFTQVNEFHQFISQTYNSTDMANLNMAAGIERSRVSSFAFHAIYYGFLLTIIFLLHLFSTLTFSFTKKRKLFSGSLIALILINLILVNSRTPLFSLGLGLLIFFIWGLKPKQKLRVAIVSLVALTIVGTVMPNSSKLVSATLETFSSDGASGSEYETGSSSFEMREMQMAASFLIFNNSPILGNGFNYIVEGLGYSSDRDKRRSDPILGGFESYSYKLLIEQGLCGILGNLVLFASLFSYFIKNARAGYNQANGNKLAIISTSMLVVFITFIFGTGDMGSFLFFMSVMGINIKTIALYREQLRALSPPVEQSS